MCSLMLPRSDGRGFGSSTPSLSRIAPHCEGDGGTPRPAFELTDRFFTYAVTLKDASPSLG
jgi:hypothetical protein